MAHQIEMSAFPELNIVIVNWNLKEDTLACVQSLVDAGAEPGQIIVVDNGSQDGSAAAIRERFGESIPLLQTGRNLGFAGGNNLGIEHALAGGAGWVLMMNNDTVVAPDFLEALKKATHSSNNYGILAPLIFYYDEPETVWYLGDRLIPGTLITINPYRGHPAPGGPALVPVDFVSGCGMMVRRDIFEKVGLLDTTMFMYAEEVDWCWRAREAGYQLACSTEARMWHKISTSANRDRPQTRYLRIRNQIRVYHRYAQGWQLPLMFAFVCVRTLGIGLKDVIQGQFELILPLWRGWWDGWRMP